MHVRSTNSQTRARRARTIITTSRTQWNLGSTTRKIKISRQFFNFCFRFFFLFILPVTHNDLIYRNAIAKNHIAREQMHIHMYATVYSNNLNEI